MERMAAIVLIGMLCAAVISRCVSISNVIINVRLLALMLRSRALNCYSVSLD